MRFSLSRWPDRKEVPREASGVQQKQSCWEKRKRKMVEEKVKKLLQRHKETKGTYGRGAFGIACCIAKGALNAALSVEHSRKLVRVFSLLTDAENTRLKAKKSKRRLLCRCSNTNKNNATGLRRGEHSRTTNSQPSTRTLSKGQPDTYRARVEPARC